MGGLYTYVTSHTFSIRFAADTRDTEPRASTSFRLNVLATLLVPSIVPFTFAFIVPTNDKLIAKKDELAGASLTDKSVEANGADGESVHELIDRWAVLNLVRAGLVAAGAACAVAAVVVG